MLIQIWLQVFACYCYWLFVCYHICLFSKAVEWSMFAYFQVADNNLRSFKSNSKLEPTCCSPPLRVDLYLHAAILSHRYNAILLHHNSKSGNPKHFRRIPKLIKEENWLRWNQLIAHLISHHWWRISIALELKKRYVTHLEVLEWMWQSLSE